MQKKSGFTLIELLIVVAILAILILTALFSVNRQRDKAQDAKAKSELSRLKIAFEEYYNDHNCYPPATWFDDADDCGTAVFRPYLAQIPCDHQTGLPYKVEYDGTACSEWFKLYASLKIPSEEVETVCTSAGSTLGNYGVSSSNTTVSINCDSFAASPTPTPIPIPSTTPGTYACTPQGACNGYSAENLILFNCPVTFNSGESGSQCVTYCAGAGSARCSQ